MGLAGRRRRAEADCGMAGADRGLQALIVGWPGADRGVAGR
jgi:hypothetical protein